MAKTSKEKIIRTYNVITDDSPFGIVEAFRNIKTNLCFSIPRKSDDIARRICISSANMADGKSTISVNSAITFAKSNIKTILIDCDLRKPKLNKFFALKNDVGLSNYLSGQVAKEDILQSTNVPNLTVIAAGVTPPNPLELISSDIMKELVDSLSKEYGCIIIDSPPIESVSDALVLSEIVDGLVLVVKYKQTTHGMIQDVLRKLELAKGKLLGFVLNEMVSAKSNKYYKYGYEDKG